MRRSSHSASRIRVYTPDPLLSDRRYTSNVWRIIPFYRASSFSFFPIFFPGRIWPICQAILRIHGGRWGRCIFFLSFIFFLPLFVESAMSRPLQTYETGRACVCARVFFASNARESTRRTTLCSRVITEMKVYPAKRGSTFTDDRTNPTII